MFLSFSASIAASNNSAGKQTGAFNLKPLKPSSQKTVENGAQKHVTNTAAVVGNTPEACDTIEIVKGSPEITLVDASSSDSSIKSANANDTTNAQIKDSNPTTLPEQDFSADVFEVSGTDNQFSVVESAGDESITSGITIEDNDDDIVEQPNPKMVNVKEMESEIVIWRFLTKVMKKSPPLT